MLQIGWLLLGFPQKEGFLHVTLISESFYFVMWASRKHELNILRKF